MQLILFVFTVPSLIFSVGSSLNIDNEASSQNANVKDSPFFSKLSLHNHVKRVAIGLAAHDLEMKILYAILADVTMRRALENDWGVKAIRLQTPLKTGKKIFICVPLDASNGHVHLDHCELW